MQQQCGHLNRFTILT